MKYAKKMYFTTNAEGTKNESFISSFEKDILKIFRNKDVSSEDRIGEYKKIVQKYEYNHYQYENKNDKISNSVETKDDEGTSEDDFQLHDPNRIDQTDDGATYSNDKKFNAFGILDNKTNVVNDFKFLKRYNVKGEKKKRKKKDKENVNKHENNFQIESMQTPISQTDTIEQIHLNNIRSEKFENNDNLTFLDDKKSHFNLESMPFMVADNTAALVSPNYNPNPSPISMYYDFEEDDKDVDKRKTSLVDLNRKEAKLGKTKQKRKPTGIGKQIAKNHDNKSKKRAQVHLAKKLNNNNKNRFHIETPKPLKLQVKSKRKRESDLDDDEIELETRRQTEMNLLNKNTCDNLDENDIKTNRLVELNSNNDENDNHTRELNKNKKDNPLNSILIQKFKKNKKPLKRLRTKQCFSNQEKDRNRKFKDKKSNKRKKYQLEEDYPNKKFKVTDLKLFYDENNEDDHTFLTDEDTSSTIVNLKIIE
jgi:hypothetical protein